MCSCRSVWKEVTYCAWNWNKYNDISDYPYKWIVLRMQPILSISHIFSTVIQMEDSWKDLLNVSNTLDL
jgi:hypothetical protein